MAISSISCFTPLMALACPGRSQELRTPTRYPRWLAAARAFGLPSALAGVLAGSWFGSRVAALEPVLQCRMSVSQATYENIVL